MIVELGGWLSGLAVKYVEIKLKIERANKFGPKIFFTDFLAELDHSKNFFFF